MPIRPYSFLAALGLIAAFIPSARAQGTPSCECTPPGAEQPLAADTVFHVVEYFDVALCGRIDCSVAPFVYTDFTMRSCGRAPVALPPRTPGRACHIAISQPYLVVDEFALLPTGNDMHLENRPCRRTRFVMRVHEDTLQYAINAMRELIATFEKPTPTQLAQVQLRLDHAPMPFWTDKELLGQVFLCAVYDAGWAARFKALRDQYSFGGTMAEYYEELLGVYHDISRSSSISR
ncbi:MAG: hypothetical protein ABI599_03140 [Flavobacteriales bacterium]